MNSQGDPRLAWGLPGSPFHRPRVHDAASLFEQHRPKHHWEPVQGGTCCEADRTDARPLSVPCHTSLIQQDLRRHALLPLARMPESMQIDQTCPVMLPGGMHGALRAVEAAFQAVMEVRGGD